MEWADGREKETAFVAGVTYAVFNGCSVLLLLQVAVDNHSTVIVIYL